MNPVLILTHNNLELTKRCVDSVYAQDIPTTVIIMDNGSTDGTQDWIRGFGGAILGTNFPYNAGVSAGWNRGIDMCHRASDVQHLLCIGNDTVIPPWFYRELLSYDVQFVTGVAVDNMAMIAQPPDQRYPLTENPDFSAFLIRRDCWMKIGPFDERMALYASDTDYHVRAHRLGVKLYKACCPYYHERSSTLNNAEPQERQEIQEQANRDREVFRSLYGCLPGTPEYSALFE